MFLDENYNIEKRIKHYEKVRDAAMAWCTARNVMELNSFTDPITLDLHFIVKAKTSRRSNDIIPEDFKILEEPSE